jgi:hypothetical protein
LIISQSGSADGELGLNYLCAGFKRFFAHALPEIDQIVADLRKSGVRQQARM